MARKRHLLLQVASAVPSASGSINFFNLETLWRFFLSDRTENKRSRSATPSLPPLFKQKLKITPRGSMQILVILSTNPTKFQDIGLHPSKWQKTEGYGHRSPILAPSESKNNAESCSLTCSRFNFHPSHRGFHWKWRQIFTGGGKYAMTHWHCRWSLAAWPKSGIGKSASSSSENRTRGKNCGDRHATTEQYRCSTISTCRSESYRYYKLSSFLIGSSEPTGLKDSKG